MQQHIVSFHPMLAADRTIVLESRRALCRADALAVSRADAVLLPLAPRPDVYALATALGKPVFPRPHVFLSLDGKVGNQRLFRALGLPCPPAVEFGTVAEALAAWRGGAPEVTALGNPLVVKGAGGGMGCNVFMARGPEDLAEAANLVDTRSAHGPHGLIFQRFVAGGGADLRVALLGDEHRAYWRIAPPGAWRSNVSQGATVDFLRRPADIDAGVALARELARRAGIDMAGVDVIFGPDGAPSLLEVNFYFGRSALGGSDAFLELYLAAARRWLGGLGLDGGRIGLADDDLQDIALAC